MFTNTTYFPLGLSPSACRVPDLKPVLLQMVCPGLVENVDRHTQPPESNTIILKTVQYTAVKQQGCDRSLITELQIRRVKA